MKTKKIVFAAVISALVLTAAGCGTEDGNTDTDTKPDAKSSAALSETEEPEEPEGPRSTSNTACDVGEFTVFVPEGWEAIPVPDPIDSSKTAANDILLARGAEYIPASDHWTYDSGPYFYVTLADKETLTKVSTSRDYYVEEFGSVSPIGADVYIMWAEAGDSGFYSSISTAYDLSLDDPDIQTMLSSIELKE